MSSLKLKLGLSNGLIIGKLGFPGASDSIAPTITITCAQTSPTATTPLNFTFTLSEPSTDFAIGDITVGNGVASNFAGSGASYTCDIAPTAGGAVTVDVAANAFHDSAGNGNVAATQFSITYAPTQAIRFVGATPTYIDMGSDTTIDDLADNAFTFEIWIKSKSGSVGNGTFISKAGGATVGWYFLVNQTTAALNAIVLCATTNASVTQNGTISMDVWHHLAMTFDDAGDRKIRVWVDGTEITYGTQVAGVGAIKSDASVNAYLGGFSAGAFYNWTGDMGWARISNNLRYTANFTAPSRTALPSNDANTVRLYLMNEGTGTNINDSSTSALDATLSGGTWVASP